MQKQKYKGVLKNIFIKDSQSLEIGTITLGNSVQKLLRKICFNTMTNLK